MKYVIGVDFGTLSARAVIIDTEDGKEIASFSSEYEHAVLDEALPSGKKLDVGAALQVPSDYIKALSCSIKGVLEISNISPCEIVGLGIDFTSSTVLPIYKDGTPLCENEKYKDEPHAYVKLWKHSTARKEAEEITELAKRRGESWLGFYGGKISAELMMPKILETARLAPDVYRDADRFIEAGDWITLVLTGKETRSPTFAGYKALWNFETGYPDNDFFKELDTRLDGIIGTKIPVEVAASIDASAGKISEYASRLTGLSTDTVVALPLIDAHASLAGSNVCESGEVVMIVGTSCCHILNSEKQNNVEGIFGYVRDGVFPGLFTYEAGQSAVGDMFDWFVKNSVPASYEKEAEAKGIGIHKLLRDKATALEIGESGLIALDWWNGNRSILADSSLTGMLCGLTLRTKPEEIYRALLESVVFGAKVILDQYEKFGITTSRITATGGIAQKDPLLMQIYADVLNKEINVTSSALSGAVGSAVYAAAAAGLFPSIKDAANTLASKPQKVYRPIKENVERYSRLFEKYLTLHDYFSKNKI